ncbi:hypothetical protein [Hufsiella ginkgonis]|uniref:Uncharacterized protein n=1 Tax=Hufsiella ginkgonis TaxID=2695274 RepID=A0A7K1XTZ2_9SPHI|nr:hypothetical protein [Hufsiella ginkgonis]MXV14229.1 hypothetical protein [Hufsiella ginkgonis]
MNPFVVPIEEIRIFKTNIRYKKDLQAIAKLFAATGCAMRWNVDLKEPDRILRVERCHLASCELIALIQQAGFSCEEIF